MNMVQVNDEELFMVNGGLGPITTGLIGFAVGSITDAVLKRVTGRTFGEHVDSAVRRATTPRYRYVSTSVRG